MNELKRKRSYANNPDSSTSSQHTNDPAGTRTHWHQGPRPPVSPWPSPRTATVPLPSTGAGPALAGCVEGSSPGLANSCMDVDPHLSSRTRKRFRDSRPGMGQIHENTLKMMYANAQTIQASASMQGAQIDPSDESMSLFSHEDQNFASGGRPLVSRAPFASTIYQQHQQQQQFSNAHQNDRQRSLDSFWDIPRKAGYASNSSKTMTQWKENSSFSAQCQDCDSSCIDTLTGTNTTYECASCKRMVCDGCAVVRIQRLCLDCNYRFPTGVSIP